MKTPESNQDNGNELENESSEYVTNNDDGSITIRLQTPITYKNGKGQNVTVETFKMEEPDGEMMEKVDDVRGDMRKTLKVIQLLSKLPPDVVKKMKSRDVMRIQKAANSFFGE